jgi:uncharacterized protein
MVNSMKKYGVLSVLSLLMLFFMIGCATQEETKSFFWELSKEGSSNKLYILGSLNFRDKEMHPPKKAVENAFEQSKNLILQGDPRVQTDEMIEDYGIYDVEKNLKDNISQQLYIELEKEFNQYDVDMENILWMKPWLIANQLSLTAISRLPYLLDHTPDDYFANVASNKNVFELESYEDQFRLLSELSSEQGEMMIEDGIMTINNLEEKSKKIIEAFKNGDRKGVEEVVFSNLVKNPSLKPLYQKLFFEKSIDFANQIDQVYAQGEDSFVVLSSGFLVGDEDVLSLLEQKGYRITQR